MLNLKGVYEWKLVDKDTGYVVQEGKQENTITDTLLYYTIGTSGPTNFSQRNFVIFLSNYTLPMPVKEYRRYLVAYNELSSSIVASSSSIQATKEPDANIYNVAYNFSPPVATRVITVMGLHFDGRHAMSFIPLSSSITQNTTQYLYVKYIISLEFVSGGVNTPDNVYFRDYWNTNFNSLFWSLGTIYQASIPYSPRIALSHLIEPVNKDLMQYNPQLYAYSLSSTSTGSTFAQQHSFDLSVSTYQGPIGSLYRYYSWTGGSWPEGKQIMNYYPSGTNIPSISRIFTRSAGRTTPIFSDPAYPPDSKGNVIVSGSPTNTWHMIARLLITKTGDASDIVDGHGFTTNIGGIPDQLIVDQDWVDNEAPPSTKRDTIRLYGGSLPAPLIADTDYYVVYVDSTHIKLSSSSTGSPTITLTSDGSGTIDRMNTAKYALELEPWSGEKGRQWISNLYLGYNFDGDAISVASPIDLFKEGEFLYGLYDTGGYLNIARWRFYTIEGPEPILKFGSEGISGRAMVRGKGSYVNFAYIATSEGMYKYNITTPTVAPVLMSISGIIDNDITDIAYDEITDYLWSGHTTGLSRIDLSSDTAQVYTIANGSLAGLNSEQANIRTAQLTAYNGRVLRGGYGSTGTKDAWVLEDGVGYYPITYPTSTYGTYGGTIDKTTERILLRHYGYSSTEELKMFVYEVTVTGVNTGSQTLLYQPTGFQQSRYDSSQILQISKDKFIVSNNYPSGKIYNVATYTMGSSVSLSEYVPINNVVGRSCSRHPIDVGNGLYVMPNATDFAIGAYPTSIRFGWNGSTWIKDGTVDRNVPKTVSHPLLDNLSIVFNNATGYSWDTQFVLDERFQFVYGPSIIKDNLQAYSFKTRVYSCNTASVENKDATLTDPIYTITEKSDPDFRDMDTVDFVTSICSIDSSNTFTANPTTDILTIGADIPSGTSVTLSSTGVLPAPLQSGKTYYVINISSTEIKLAHTYERAMATIPIPIDITDSGTGTHTQNTTTIFTQVSTGVDVNITADPVDDHILLSTVNSIPTGTPFRIWNATPPTPLQDSTYYSNWTEYKFYYAINVDSQTIRVANTYAEALANTYVDITSTAGVGARITYYNIATGEYRPFTDGNILFSKDDVGKDLKLTYNYTLFD